MIDGLHPTTPRALRHPAQGCEERATLGDGIFGFLQPQRGCVMGGRWADGRNPVGVVSVSGALPKVAPRTAQPWAGGRNPVGILQDENGGAK